MVDIEAGRLDWKKIDKAYTGTWTWATADSIDGTIKIEENPMPQVNIFSRNPASQGAKVLAEAMDIKSLRHEGSNYTPKPEKFVINWGSADALPKHVRGSSIINPPELVYRAANKLEFFEYMGKHGVSIPEWTRDIKAVNTWLDLGSHVCARKKLMSHGGDGLVIIKKPLDIVAAPCYTRYIKKKHEYRLHYVGHELICIQRKAVRDGEEPLDWQVRTHNNGFIYIQNGFKVPDVVVTEATHAFDMSHLDFGAVDVIWNEKQDKAYVLEINTAPGLSGRTIESYREAMWNVIEGRLYL